MSAKKTMADKVVGYLAAYSRIKFRASAAMTADVAELEAALKAFVKSGFSATDSNLRELAECTITELHLKHGKRNKALMNALGAIGRVMSNETTTVEFAKKFNASLTR